MVSGGWRFSGLARILLGGAPGAAVGMAVANLAPAPLFWLQMERVLRRPAVGVTS